MSRCWMRFRLLPGVSEKRQLATDGEILSLNAQLFRCLFVCLFTGQVSETN